MKIEHEQGHHRFIARPPGGGEAALLYAHREGVLDIYHVFVPPEARGHGLAGRLTQTAFEYAREMNLKVIPTCPYVRNEFLSRHPEYQSLVETSA